MRPNMARRSRCRYGCQDLAMRVLALAVGVGVGFGVVWLTLGCGTPLDPEGSSTTVDIGTSVVEPMTTSIKPPETEYFTLGWGESATIEGAVRVTVEEPLVDNDASPVEVPVTYSEQVVVYCMITIKNIGTDALAYDQREFRLRADDGGWYGGGKGLTTSLRPALLSGNLAPGCEVRGAVPFQLGSDELGSIRGVQFYYRSATIAAEVEWR